MKHAQGACLHHHGNAFPIKFLPTYYYVYNSHNTSIRSMKSGQLAQFLAKAFMIGCLGEALFQVQYYMLFGLIHLVQNFSIFRTLLLGRAHWIGLYVFSMLFYLVILSRKPCDGEVAPCEIHYAYKLELRPKYVSNGLCSLYWSRAWYNSQKPSRGFLYRHNFITHLYPRIRTISGNFVDYVNWIITYLRKVKIIQMLNCVQQVERAA